MICGAGEDEMLMGRYQTLAGKYLLISGKVNTKRYALEGVKVVPLRVYSSRRGVIIIIIAGSLLTLAKSIAQRQMIL